MKTLMVYVQNLRGLVYIHIAREPVRTFSGEVVQAVRSSLLYLARDAGSSMFAPRYQLIGCAHANGNQIPPSPDISIVFLLL